MTNEWGRGVGDTANPKHSKHQSVLKNKLGVFVQTATLSIHHSLRHTILKGELQKWHVVETLASKEASTQNSKSLGKGHIGHPKPVLLSWKMQGRETVSPSHRWETSYPPTLCYSCYWEVVSHSRTQMRLCLDDETLMITRTCSFLQDRRQLLVFPASQIS